MDREAINAVFNKLAVLAGSREASWRAIAECHAKYQRTPTLREVVEHITGVTDGPT